MHDPSQPPLIPETLLKKRRSLEELALRRAERLQTEVKRRRVVRGENVKITRPEILVRQKRIREGSRKKYMRKRDTAQKKLESKGKVVDESLVKCTVGFVVRVHEARNASRAVKAQLKALGLVNKYEAVFIRLDQQMLANLRAIESYVAYGFISQKSCEELIHRHAHVNIEGVKQPLSDNTIVEKLLGEYNLICLEDLVHEIFNIGQHFVEAKTLLLPFTLSEPVGNFEKKILKVKEDQGGFKGDGMESFLSRIM